MTQHNNAWYVENAGMSEVFLREAHDLQQQAEALLGRSREKARDASELNRNMSFHKGVAVQVEHSTLTTNQPSLRITSLPILRSAHVYQTKENGWAGNLSIIGVDRNDSKVRHLPSSMFSGGMFLGFYWSEAAITNAAYEWVAFGEIPESNPHPQYGYPVFA